MQVYNIKIVTNATMNTTINSAPYNVQQMYGYCIQAEFTGAPTGTLKLQASNDPATSYLSGNTATNNPVTNWTDITNSSFAVASAGSFMWNVFDVMYNWVRLVYTDGSGGASTAVLNANINAKAP